MKRLPVLAYALVVLSATVHAAEPEPTLTTADFANLPPLKGTGYSVDATVPVRGYHGQFTLHTNQGDVVADGVQMLRQRIAELAPAAELEKISGTEVFVDALGKSAKNTATAVGKAVTNPVDTMKAMPAGVGRFFKSAGDSAKSASSGDAGDATKDALGVNKAKRGLAKMVGVDPYTTNPVVAKRLDSLANAAFAGGVSLDVVMAVSTAGVATALSVTKTVSNLAWDLPPEDVRKRNDEALGALGVSAGARGALLGNRWYTPTMALAFVESLKALGAKSGAEAFVALAAKSESESEARFYIAQLVMAKQYAASGDAIASIEAPGQVGIFRTVGGNAFVPAPADWLAHTDGVDAFAKRPVANATQKIVWLTGKASPAAKQALGAAGWTLRESVALQ